ncbi:MAG: hypothetical protein LBD55_11070, partial [Treponema sp.]|nr:hypothetical protein [Treponema sp.]
MSHSNGSSAARFTVISLAVLTLITVSLSLVFFINFYTLSHDQIEITLGENIARLRDTVTGKFNEWSAMIRYAAFGAAPFMAQKPPDTQALQTLLSDIVDSQSDMAVLYCTNNLVWNEPGGYAVFSDGGVREPAWNNTRRSWFIKAKTNPGKVAYTDPFISATTRNLSISVSTNVYDEAGRDLGVVSGSVLIDILGAMLQSNVFLPRQQIFLINEQGLFIAESDTGGEMFITKPGRQSVLQRDFFISLNLEQYRDDILSSPSFFKMDSGTFIYSAPIPNAGWTLVSLVPASVIFTGMNRSLTQILCLNF